MFIWLHDGMWSLDVVCSATRMIPPHPMQFLPRPLWAANSIIITFSPKLCYAIMWVGVISIQHLASMQCSECKSCWSYVLMTYEVNWGFRSSHLIWKGITIFTYTKQSLRKRLWWKIACCHWKSTPWWPVMHSLWSLMNESAAGLVYCSICVYIA
jgi:hypothetical protein